MSNFKMYVALGDDWVDVKETDTKQFEAIEATTDWNAWKNYQDVILGKADVNNKAISYAIACEKLKKLSNILEKSSVYLRGSGSTAVIDTIPGSDFPSPYSAIVEIEKWKMENKVKMKTVDDTISLQFIEEENVAVFFEKEITQEKIEVAIRCVPVR